MQVKSKVWLEKNGKLIFGSGKAEILKAVNKHGSLNKAAQELNMSYRHVWSQIKSVETHLGKPLLIKTKGGLAGGGAILTDEAKELLEKFIALENRIKDLTDKKFKEIFITYD